MALGNLVIKLGLNASEFVKGLQGVAAKVNREVGGIKKSFGQLNRAAGRLSDMGKQMTAGITLPLAGVAAAATKTFADFDAAMTESLAIMGNVSDALRSDMAQAAREMAKQTTFSADEAAKAYFYLASAGLDAQQSIQALPVVAKFAQAGMFDLSRATDLLTDAQSALGLTIRDDAIANMQEMARVSDVLVKANTLANASVEQFSEALTNKAGAAMRQVGMDIEEGVAVLAAFADQGIKGAEAGTQFSIVLRDLQTKAINNKEAFAQLGVSVFDSQGELRNMGDIIGQLEGALAGMSDEQQKATLLMLGFTDKSVAALQTLLGTSDAIDRYESALRAAGGTTEEVASKQLESFSAKLSLLKSKALDIFITLGESLIPALESLMRVIEPVVDVIAGMAQRFGELPRPVQDAVIAIGALVAAIGPVAFVAGQAVQAAIGLKAAFAGAQAAAVAAAPAFTAMKGALVALKGPLLALVAAFAGWKLGKWARQNIPAVKKLGDAIGGLLVKLPLVERAIMRLTGAEKAQRRAADDLNYATRKLEESLRRKGIVIDRGKMSAEEYAAALRKAAAEASSVSSASRSAADGLGRTTAEAQRAAPAISRTSDEIRDLNKWYREYLDLTVRDFTPPADSLEDLRRAAAAANEQLRRNVDTMTDAVAAAGGLQAQIPPLGDAFETDLEAPIRETSQALDESTGVWRAWANQVSTIVTDLSSDIADSIIGLFEPNGRPFWERVRDSFRSMLEDMGKAIIRFGTEYLTGKLFKWLKEDLLDSIIPRIKDGFNAIFGAARQVGQAVGVGGAGAGAVAGGGAAAGGAGGAAGGIAGTIGAIGAVGSMVTGIIGNFQMYGMNKSLDLIVLHTLQTANQLIYGIQPVLNQYLPGLGILTSPEGPLWQIRDDLVHFIGPKLDTIASGVTQVRDAVKQININVTVSGGSPQEIASAIEARLLRLQGVTA